MTRPSLQTPLLLGNHSVPGIWRYMLPYELQTFGIPEERVATCDRCPRIHTDKYRADYRCCTYHPRVPNFLLGLAASQNDSMRKKLEAMNEQGWLLPEGFQTTPQKWAVYLADTNEDRYGKNTTILCPFLIEQNGFCSLYAFRNSVCSTFFCSNDAGKKGHNFWEKLQDIVVQTEMALSQYGLEAIGFNVDKYHEKLNQLAPEINEVVDKKTGLWNKKTRKHLWGSFYGREIECFLEIAKIMDDKKDELWDIANSIPLGDAVDFERAGFDLVDPKHRDDLDENDYAEDAEAAAPQELWGDLVKAHRKLWQISSEEIQLSGKIVIKPNEAHDDLAKSYADKPIELVMLNRKGGKKEEWRLFVSEHEAEALRLFQSPSFLTDSIAQRIESITNRSPKSFAAEWLGKKVLVKVSS